MGQQDATEITRWLLDQCGSSVTNHSFGGSLQTHVTCDACGHSQAKAEEFADLCLPVIAVVGEAEPGDSSSAGGTKATSTTGLTISALLRMYLQPEDLSDYRCDSCDVVGSSRRRYEITKAPAELIVTLSRFAFTSDGGQHKIDTRIGVDEILMVPEANLETTCNECAYHLYGVVVHSGSSPHSGHYYSLGRALASGNTGGDSGGSWYRYDDSTVRALPGVLTQEQLDERTNGVETAYILLYRRREDFPTAGTPAKQASFPARFFATAIFEDLVDCSTQSPSPKGESGFRLRPSGDERGGLDDPRGFEGDGFSKPGGGWGVC